MATPPYIKTNQQPNKKFNSFINSVLGILGCYVGSLTLMLLGFGIKEVFSSNILDWLSEILVWIFGFIPVYGSFLIFPFSIVSFVITIVRISKCNFERETRHKNRTTIALFLMVTSFVSSLIFLFYIFK
ncbi:MAG: hypothetical protein IJO44_02010 [Clostridia bacterium]|nr:hypothetical protein [Clostridia bacterium]